MVTLFAGTGKVTDAAFVGMTIGQLRTQFAGVYNIQPASRGSVNGRLEDDTYVLRANDELLFTKPAGEKGI